MNVLLGIGLLAVAATAGEGNVYTLYRSDVTPVGSSAPLQDLRIHIATFDTGHGERYNHETCEHTRELFQRELGPRVRLWCEKGRYRP